MPLSPGDKKELIKGAAAIIVAIITAAGGVIVGFRQGKAEGIGEGKTQGISEGKSQGFNQGKAEGEKGKQPAFADIPTQVSLDKTKWQVVYQDVGGKKATVEKSALITFEQFQSRVVGEGQDTSGRRWIAEGATAERRVCYIYYEPNGGRLSFGTVFLEMSNDGREMNGQWAGWAPEGSPPQPRRVKLVRIYE
jgi:hypothetical protein